MDKVEIYNWHKDEISREWFSDNLFGRSNREFGIGMSCGDLSNYDKDWKFIGSRGCYKLHILFFETIRIRIEVGVLLSRLTESQKLGILKVLADE